MEEDRHERLRLSRRIVLGTLAGTLLWVFWAPVLLAPAVADVVGVAAAFVGPAVLCGCVGGSLLWGYTRLGRHRRSLAASSAFLMAIPIVALGQPTPGPLGAFALVAAGALVAIGDGAAQSAVTASLGDERARRSGLVGYWLAKAATVFVGGPLCEWLAHRFGIALLFWCLAVICVAVGALVYRLCPDPDRDPVPAERQSSLNEERGSLWLLAAARACGTAQFIVFSVFVPLRLAELHVSGIGWTQGAFLLGIVALGLASREKAPGTAVVSLRVIALTGPVLVSSASLIALLGKPIADSALAVLAVAATARTVASIGVELHGGTLSAVAGATSKGKAAGFVGGTVGGLAAGVACGVVWSRVDPSIRYEVLLVGALVLGVASFVATHRWLASRSPRTGR